MRDASAFHINSFVVPLHGGEVEATSLNQNWDYNQHNAMEDVGTI